MCAKKTFGSIILTVLLMFCCSYAAGQPISYSNLTAGTSFSQLQINDLYVDEYGIIWVGTRKGLGRYDGNEMEMVMNGEVLRVVGDKNGHIWMLCGEGVFSMDPVTRKTDMLPIENVRTINCHDGILYTCSGNMLYKWSPDTEAFTPIKKKGFPAVITDMVFRDSEIWVGTKGKGIWKFNEEDRSCKCIVPSVCSNRMYMDSENNIWAGTCHEGLYLFGTDGRISVFDEEEALSPAILNIRILPPWYFRWWALLIWAVIIGFFIVVVMVTYNRGQKLRQSLEYEKRRNNDIELLNQSKLRFFTNISHEIRTPLTVVISQIENLMYSKEFTPSLYNKVLSIYKNSVHLKELISELLEFRKQEQGELQIKVAPHDIIKLVKEFYLVFEEYAKMRNISLHMETETDRLEVWYDQSQFQKVLRNLLANALKYTEPGGAINIFVGLSGTDMVLSVSDTGCGLSEDEKENIFRQFYRVDNIESRAQDGTGIGLAIVKGIVELHKGTVTVESGEGKGSSFIVTLPLGYSHFTDNQFALKEDSDVPLPLLKEPGNGVETENKEYTMLVVDDNEAVRKLLEEIFSPFYNIITASDGAQAWEECLAKLPDIVVTDVLMPKMNGTDLCRKIKSDVATCHIPVVLLTARVDVEHNIEGILIGADDYIAKPFDTRLLVSRCNNLVNSRKMLQEKFSRQPDMSSKILATNSLDQVMMDKATSVIEENLDNPEFNVNMFAHEMAMSRTNLFAKIKAITGQTPNEFIMTLRLKRGAYLLKNNPELSISEIADRTGFASSNYFSKCFNDLYHVRPLNYRKGKVE